MTVIISKNSQNLVSETIARSERGDSLRWILRDNPHVLKDLEKKDKEYWDNLILHS